MAGGKFDRLVGKTLPGTYINFESGRGDAIINSGIRGTAVVPLPKANYGPEKTFIKLTSQNPDAEAATFGYSIYDKDENRQMLLLREAFKRATTVYAYILSSGKNASADIEMSLEPVVEGSVAKDVMNSLVEECKKEDALKDVSLSVDRRTSTITATFDKKPSEAGEMCLSRMVRDFISKGGKVYIDGAEIRESLAEAKQMPFYKRLQKMEQGGPDVECVMSFVKDEETQDYKIVFTWPSAPVISAAKGLGDTTASENTMKAMAPYGGSRGNDLTVTVDENPLGGWDVIVHRAGDKVAEYDGLVTVEELIEKECPYVTFSGKGFLGAAAGTNLSGGDDDPVSNSDITAFIDALEEIRFDTVAFPFDGEENAGVKQAMLTKIRYMRESMGRGVQAVIPNAPGMDYEGIINVTNSVRLADGTELSVAEATAWVAGATAGASNVESLTYVKYDGASSVIGAKTNDEAVDAVNKGEMFFTVNEDDAIVVMYDINSLVTFAHKKDRSYRKNRVIRVFDTIQAAVQSNFPPNKFDNSDRGWDIMEGIGRSILKQFEDSGAIRNVDYDADFKVDRESSVDDETYFDVGIQAVDSAEKLYFTITTR